MKKHASNILLYVVIVLLPTISGSFLLTKYDEDQRHNKTVEHAEWVASIHQSHWDQFVSETVTSLQMLSLTSDMLKDDPWKMKPLLHSAANSDPRYGGLYLLNRSGRLITGSNDYSNDRLYQTNFVQEVIDTKDIIIANEIITVENNQRVIGLATPVVSDTNELEFIIVALLRVDYLVNIMKMLTPDVPIAILNNQNKVIVGFGNGNANESMTDDGWITHPINQLPWDIKVKIVDTDPKEMSTTFLLTVFLFFILSHILFLLLKYILLRRQTRHEKIQNETQKLELVGTLAASTAHEIRNPLTGIKGLVQLLKEKHSGEDDQFYFSVINDEINRINQIVSEFLILGRPTASKTEVVDFRSILKDVGPLIASEANLYNVTWNCSMPEAPVMVECAVDQLKQVILNLTKNALESMLTGGELNILLSCIQHRCVLEIKDTGTGIKKENLNKIFHPFYTSKTNGTGLGLVVCKRIIQSFQGEILIESTEGIGTTVTIHFPVINKED